MNVRPGEPLFASRAFACAAAAWLLVGVGGPLLAYLSYPAWMWGYYVDPASVSRWVVTLVLASYGAPFLLGYVAPRRLWGERRGAFWMAMLGSLSLGAAILAWQWPRYRTVTTIQEFRAGVRVPVTEIPLLSWEGPLSLGILLVLVFLAKRPRVSDRRSFP